MTGHIKAGFIAGIILFVWCCISWMVLPWHKMTIRHFGSDVAVAQIIQANVTESGIYVLPSKAFNGQETVVQNQPMVFASVVTTGMPTSMAKPMLIELATQIVAAFLVAWMLSKTNRLSYFGRVGFVLVFAFTATIIRDIPAWNWFGFDAQYTLVNAADVLVGWFIAGLVLAKLAKS